MLIQLITVALILKSVQQTSVESIYFAYVIQCDYFIEVEIRLYKVDAIQWTSLDSQYKSNAPPGEFIVIHGYE